MQTFLFVFGSLLAASGNIPYIIATMRGQAKPRIVTWFTWALLTSLASAAAFSDHQIGAGFFALLGALSTGSIAIAGFKYGDRSFTKLDITCQLGAFVGLALWLIFNNPAFGVWAAIVIDCVGLIPTIWHAWQAPHEETVITYVLVCIGGFITIVPALASNNITTTSIGYPLYTAISLGLLAALLVLRKRTLAQPVTQKAET